MTTTRLMGMTACCVLLLAFNGFADDPPYGNIRLLEGYKYKPSRTFDTINALIYKPGGLSIEFEEGINEGYAVHREE